MAEQTDRTAQTGRALDQAEDNNRAAQADGIKLREAAKDLKNASDDHVAVIRASRGRR